MKSFLFNLALVVVIAGWCSGQTLTFKESFPNYQHDGTVAGLARAELQNSPFVIFDTDGKPELTGTLQNGNFERVHGEYHAGERVHMEGVYEISSSEPEAPVALLALTYLSWAGSSSEEGIVQVMQLQNSHPVVLQQIAYNRRGSSDAGYAFNSRTGILTIKGVHGWEHCCPTTLDIGTYKWNGSRFLLVDASSAPLHN